MEARLRREIAHGRYLATKGAAEVWNWEGPTGRLRWHRRVQMLIHQLTPRMQVLELGCGIAYFTRELATTGALIDAVDISPELLAEARKNCSAANVTFEVQNAYALDYANNSYDAVVGSSVLHHLEIDRALREIYRVLRPRGHITFTEPNMLNPHIALQKNIPPIKRLLGDSPDETAFFRWPLQRLLIRAGFREVEVTPFDFLHPKTPKAWIRFVQQAADIAERTPIFREIAGSLHIRARK